jgi:tetratricopeptide (TPR) repeat protein
MIKSASILSLIACLLLYTACGKYLSLEDPQSVSDSTALASDDGIKSVLNGAYSQFANPGLYRGVLPRNAEFLGGSGEIMYVGPQIDERDIFNKSMIANNGEIAGQWLASYGVINTVNNILNSINRVSENDRDRVKGEALFLRGLIYFDLVRFFAQQYQYGTANTQPGVPLILTPSKGADSGIYVKRSTVGEVYSQVIADLLEAKDRLPLENGVYASQGAASALLARVYMQKGDFEKARDASDRVIESGIYSLLPEYAMVFNNDNNSAEDIFATQVTHQGEINFMTLFFSTLKYGGTDYIQVLSGHFELYSNGDKRKELFFSEDGALRTGKWNNKYGVVNLFRLAEMYLIRAESNIRLGTSVGASPVEDYNAIHTRAGLPAVSSVTLQDILLERRLEMAFEGFRIHDIRRLHENVASYPYDDPRLVFPIPARELDANPSLRGEQNPGY